MVEEPNRIEGNKSTRKCIAPIHSANERTNHHRRGKTSESIKRKRMHHLVGCFAITPYLSGWILTSSSTTLSGILSHRFDSIAVILVLMVVVVAAAEWMNCTDMKMALRSLMHFRATNNTTGQKGCWCCCYLPTARVALKWKIMENLNMECQD